MKLGRWSALGASSLALVATGLAASPAAHADASSTVNLRQRAVFVELNGGAANSIRAFARSSDGSLTSVGTFATGGKGGKQVGAPVDALASQGALAQAAGGRVLVAVNAGSDTLSSLRVGKSSIQLSSVVRSRGDFPSSVTVHGSLVYVLNAGGEGIVSGYRLHDGRLHPLPGAVRSLGLSNDAVPAFLNSPAQIGFSPDGRTLVVTTKANNTIVTFHVFRHGYLGQPIVSSSTGPVPFSFVFDTRGHLEVQQAGDGRNASYAVRRDSSLVPLGASDPSGGQALCWSVRLGNLVYGANAASGTLTSWTIAADGLATVNEPIAATVGPGVIDLAASTSGRHLYALDAVSGTVSIFTRTQAGTLVPSGQVSGLPVISDDGGPEGIVAQ
jgi:6-phosphogluconolactonase (cycloisomerase 2 family)